MPWELFQQGNDVQKEVVRNAIKKFCTDLEDKKIVSLKKNEKNKQPENFNFKSGEKSVVFQCPNGKDINNQSSLCVFDVNKEDVVEKVILARNYRFESNLCNSNNHETFLYINVTSKNLFCRKVKKKADKFEIISTDNKINWNDYLVIVEINVNATTNKNNIVDLTYTNGKTNWDLLHQRLATYSWAKQWIEDHPSKPAADDQDLPGLSAEPIISIITKEIADVLKYFPNVILEGVPGTGKTYHVGELPTYNKTSKPAGYEKRWITFHPAVSYEDFMEGIRPAAASQPAAASKLDDDSPPLIFEPRSADTSDAAKANGFAVREGFFLKVCRKAYDDPHKKFLVVIDEINRANLPNVLGDLLTVLEADKRLRYDAVGKKWIADNRATTVTLPYSGYGFAVPENVFVIGTMNTTDKSIAPIDAALRRRFAFIRIEPKTADEITQKVPQQWLTKMKPSILTWNALNEVLREQLGPDGILGHSYLLQLATRLAETGVNADSAIRMCWQYELLPQLIDTLTNHAAVELIKDATFLKELEANLKELEAKLPANWANDARLNKFEYFLGTLGLTLTLEGNGFGRGLRIGTLPTPAAGAGTADDQPAEAGHSTGSEQDQAEQPAAAAEPTVGVPESKAAE